LGGCDHIWVGVVLVKDQKVGAYEGCGKSLFYIFQGCFCATYVAGVKAPHFLQVRFLHLYTKPDPVVPPGTLPRNSVFHSVTPWL
jgi:hypothetical protein